MQQPLAFPNGWPIGNASGVFSDANPPYAISDFVSVYPQFGPDANGNYIVPQTVLQVYINLASASLNQGRWQDAWYTAMGWFVAHFATLWLQSTQGLQGGASAGKVLAAGEARGLTSAKSVGDLSKSIDYSSISNDLDGWAAWKLTLFGQQLATMGQLVGMGAMYAW